jgi:hypothetical protein
MTEPSLALQGAVVGRLKADTAVGALVGDRIYDRVKEGPTFPYIAWGDDQVLDDSTDCHDDVEVFTTLHIWSRTVGRVEAKQIAQAVRASLHDQEFTLTDNALIVMMHDSTRILRDPDGLTSHAVIVFRSLIQAA